MKRLGISRLYSICLRLGVGLLVGGITSKLPQSWFTAKIDEDGINLAMNHTDYHSLFELLQNSLYESLSLSIKVIVLVTALIFFLDFIKSLAIIEKHSKKINSGFSILVGVILGITYGAGIPISVFQVRNHISGLNPFTDRIGEHSFQTITGIKLDTTLICNQQNNQSVIFIFLPYTPFIK
jgi:hypothetical protein